MFAIAFLLHGQKGRQNKVKQNKVRPNNEKSNKGKINILIMDDHRVGISWSIKEASCKWQDRQ